MTPTLQLDNHSTLVISPSGLDKLRTCPRLWWHTYGWRRISSKPNMSAVAGKAFDAALNLRYTHAHAQAVGQPLQDLMLQEVDRAFEGVSIPEMEDRCTPARYKEVVQAYNEHYKEEPFDILAVQMPFEVELGEVAVPDEFWRLYFRQHSELSGPQAMDLIGQPLRVNLHGILDRLVYLRSTGQYFVLDTKTHKDFGPMQQASYDNHAQFKAYMWAVPQISKQAQDKQLTAGLPPELVAKMSCLPTEVHGAIADIVVVRPPYKREFSATKSNAKPRNEFFRVTKFYSQERLEEWRRDTLLIIEQAMQMVALNHFPQNERACANIYGKPCAYLGVCSGKAEQQAIALGTDEFKDYKGGPLAESK